MTDEDECGLPPGWFSAAGPPLPGQNVNAAIAMMATRPAAAITTPLLTPNGILLGARRRPPVPSVAACRRDGCARPPVWSSPTGGQVSPRRSAAPAQAASIWLERLARRAGLGSSLRAWRWPGCSTYLGGGSRRAGCAAGGGAGGIAAISALASSPGLVSGCESGPDRSCMARTARSESAIGTPATTWRGLHSLSPLTGAGGRVG